MVKTCILTAAVLALCAAPALAQPPRASSAAPPQAPSAAQTAAPAAVVAAPAVGVVVDPETGTAVVVPVNPRADTPPEVTALLEGLYATGKIKPGQVGQIVIKRGNQVTEVIANAPVP